jgi:hypothetical protein
MKYTTTEGQSFDPEILRQELVATFGAEGNKISTAPGSVDYLGEGDASTVILAHFNNGAAREEQKLRDRVKAIRASALDRFPKNSGIATVYEQNFEAALKGASDTTTILRNGKTPAQHLGDFGVRLGMTASQFEAYIFSENLLAGQKMTEIEAAYLTAYYGATITEQTVTDYQTYCDARAA